MGRVADENRWTWSIESSGLDQACEFSRVRLRIRFRWWSAADNASSVWRRSRDSTERIVFRFMVRQAHRHSVSTFSRPT
jgi:hypothetical protein